MPCTITLKLEGLSDAELADVIDCFRQGGFEVPEPEAEDIVFRSVLDAVVLPVMLGIVSNASWTAAQPKLEHAWNEVRRRHPRLPKEPPASRAK